MTTIIQNMKVIHSSGLKADRRVRLEIRVFVVMFAAIFLGGAEGAWALPVGFGTTCILSGSTFAESGNPGVLSGDTQILSGACGSSQVTSHGLVQVPVVTINGPNLYGFAQNATTSATANASLGSLGVSAISQADSTPASYIYTTTVNTGGIVENLYRANAQSSATSAWYDQITVGGTANANGYVVLQFTLDLHGSTSVSLADTASASIASRFFIDDRSRYFSQQILGLGAPGTISDTIGFHPGDHIQLYGDLMANANALAGQKYVNACNTFFCQQVAVGYFPDSNAIADASNTAGFHIDVLTPGGSYSSLSTQSYLTAASPVPVPAAVWLFGSGLLGLIGVARRKRAAA